jgi:hypothetical protein
LAEAVPLRDVEIGRQGIDQIVADMYREMRL